MLALFAHDKIRSADKIKHRGLRKSLLELFKLSYINNSWNMNWNKSGTGHINLIKQELIV